MQRGSQSIKRFIPLLLILLIGVWLRFHALAQDSRFHPDEALFSTFARAAAINGDWMLPGALDKTPLAIYANALSQVFMGDNEFAARLPGTLAGILLIAVMYPVARRFYCDSTAIFAAIFAALSPIAITYSATAFTDGLLLLFIVMALWLIAYGRWGWGGLALALGVACKQQALFYVPLVLAVGLICAQRTAPKRRLVNFAVLILCGVAALFLWDFARGETSIFALAAANNDPWRLIRANEILPRLTTWLDYSQHLVGSGWLMLVLMLIALMALCVRAIRQPRQRAVTIDLILFAFVIAFCFLHWLVAFNTYDRYLLPILPPTILLAARGVSWVNSMIDINGESAWQGQIRDMLRAKHCFAPTNTTHKVPTNSILHHLIPKLNLSSEPIHRRGNWTDHTYSKFGDMPINILLFTLGVVLLLPAIDASEGHARINDEQRQYTGIDVLANYLNDKPVATVIYDRWLGWELGYYLGQWTDKRRVYYPTPDELVRGALSLCEIGARYLPAPANQPISPWLDALREAGFGVSRVYDTQQFVVYEIIPFWVASNAESSSPGQMASCADDAP